MVDRQRCRRLRSLQVTGFVPFDARGERHWAGFYFENRWLYHNHTVTMHTLRQRSYRKKNGERSHRRYQCLVTTLAKSRLSFSSDLFCTTKELYSTTDPGARVKW
jgi:hypothetical protein